MVETDSPDRNSPFAAADETSAAIADHVLEFLRYEVKSGRMPASLLPLQSGVGNVANAMLAGLDGSEFTDLVAFTEVIQDGMLDLLDSGTLRAASATSFGLSDLGVQRFMSDINSYKGRILLRSEEISNHPELVRRLGVIAMNGMIEADIYGNVNSTHIMGSAIMNGIGGSGDFARNAFLNFFISPSTAKGGAVSSIVPMVSHVDHTEHDVNVIVTEHGLADLRGLSPRARAGRVIASCAHPRFRDRLLTMPAARGLRTPMPVTHHTCWARPSAGMSAISKPDRCNSANPRWHHGELLCNVVRPLVDLIPVAVITRERVDGMHRSALEPVEVGRVQTSAEHFVPDRPSAGHHRICTDDLLVRALDIRDRSGAEEPKVERGHVLCICERSCRRVHPMAEVDGAPQDNRFCVIECPQVAEVRPDNVPRRRKFSTKGARHPISDLTCPTVAAGSCDHEGSTRSQRRGLGHASIFVESVDE